ncbi:MAG: hypothetical protein Q8P57_00590 [Candidatus Pacearchaeota archaeon]|nr:hypothetical protein [Candidatus Pacearchaeota archaeon]
MNLNEKNLIFFLFTFLIVLTISIQGVSAQTMKPDPRQGVPTPNAPFSQLGNTCQQASYAMVLAALGFSSFSSMTAEEIYRLLLEIYGGDDSKKCFNAFVNVILNRGESATITITGSVGGPGKNYTYVNPITNARVIVIQDVNTASGPHEPLGPVPPGATRQLSTTWSGYRFGHTIRIISVDMNACFTIPEIKTATGIRKNIEVCPVLYEDKSMIPPNNLFESLISSDSSLFFNVHTGKWESVMGVITTTPGV